MLGKTFITTRTRPWRHVAKIFLTVTSHSGGLLANVRRNLLSYRLPSSFCVSSMWKYTDFYNFFAIAFRRVTIWTADFWSMIFFLNDLSWSLNRTVFYTFAKADKKLTGSRMNRVLDDVWTTIFLWPSIMRSGKSNNYAFGGKIIGPPWWTPV